MQLLRLAAVVLFVLAWLGGGLLGFQFELHKQVGLVGLGLALVAASGFVPPAPPRP